MSRSPSEPADVLVVGAGVIGLCAALALEARGRRVRVVERGRVGRGSSWANCGLVTPSHGLPLAVPGMIGKTLRWMLRGDAPFHVRPRLDPSMLAWSLNFFRRCTTARLGPTVRAKAALLLLTRETLPRWIAEARIDCEWEERGLYMVYASEQEFHAMDALDPLLAEHGLPCTRLDGAELARREPAVRAGMAGARFYGMDAHLRPDRLVSELERVLRARGVPIDEDCPVLGFEREG
ncbi:MAG TPA: FAD-dependent oxidoreductase, partial [Candidatus Polarisedimenticolaceae bacterium]|nr:FAD-dependent oxidoreductase [Candidatus Polarisedimenticolaceae bacterium]